ncbi:putative virion core protease [Parapoxvirus red deer/HL953]|uniref:Putative virion core protease n=1 Tax=Parapoxvirus red deer/HL953 TaxID=1579460 RepID=A0A0A7MER2_9POXV|nr:putative virion core protease [Parapoxvirus red deer/HL953]AIZ77286.1 putative virion core protease [Parapoxvirus red deer/HL953]
MDRYTDLVVSKIPEMGFTNLLCHIYSVVGLSAFLDVSKFKTNCNMYVVERFDKSATAGKVTCIPLAALMDFAKRGLIDAAPGPAAAAAPAAERSPQDEEALKSALLENLKRRHSFREAVSLEWTVPLMYFFKPSLREKVSAAVDFSQMPLQVDDLARAGVHTGVNAKVVPVAAKPDRSAWMSNVSIQNLVAPFAHASEVTYLGQFNLNFLNGAAIHEKSERFRGNTLYLTLKDRVARAGTRYVMFGFCYMFHWKCCIFDSESRLVSFYDSGGNSPSEFHPCKYFYFFSFSDGFNVNSSSADLDNRNCDVDVLMRFFVDNFKARRGCINLEVNQLLESECGMFTCIFMVLCTLRPPCNFRALRCIYTYFRFLADKKMTLLKSILFDPTAPRLEAAEVESEGMKEYAKMERWTRKSIGVLAERITDRINSLLPPDPELPAP